MADRSKLRRGRTELAGLSALALLLGACVDGDVVDLHPDGGLSGRCFSSTMYLVQGDLFTMLSSMRQTIEAKWRTAGASDQLPSGWNPRIEPRAKYQVQFTGYYEGEARLLWNDAVVESVALNPAFLESGEVAILAHEDADGRRVELHVYAGRRCETVPEVATRAAIEALEGGTAPVSDAGAVL